ncbi:hypothetical protein BDZ85DRAFT_109832 [Elsinoe ampelina]|uniref:Rhodopsin domain-containing protein n=1 Tax=Elsinoe ampelina TaxID=302913 RepID=A0A6A6GCM2_9PEZI|nr:hypothetical protein BDZ85DRAFT_109832 [Elsinoe ampelina]
MLCVLHDTGSHDHIPASSTSMQYVEWQANRENFVTYFVILTVLQFITTIAVGLRIWVRSSITRNFGKTDILLILSHLINCTASIIWLVIQTHEINYIPRSPALFHDWATPYLIAFSFYVLSGALVKIVIAGFFFKIALYPWQRILVIGPVCAYVLTLTVGANLIIFRCRLPLDSSRILSDQACAVGSASIIKLGFAVASINCLCDWIFAVVPLQMLHAAKGLSRASRVSAGCVIGLAVVGSAVSVVRLPYFGQLSFTPMFFERIPKSFMLSLVETTVAILAISMATLRPLFKLIWDGVTCRPSRIETGVVSPPRRPSVYPDADLLATEKGTETTKSLRFDSRAMVGIGILPNITLSTRAEEEGEDDDDDVESVHIQVPKLCYTRRLVSQMSIPSISQVLMESEMSGHGVDEEKGQRE